MKVSVNGSVRRYRTVAFDRQRNSILLIDQRLLPHQFKVVSIRTYQETAQAIQAMIVRGAGAIGATAAYELAGDGHPVTLIERQPGPALETSFANAGEVSPGYSAPWAGPGVPLKAVKWLLMHHRCLSLPPLMTS